MKGDWSPGAVWSRPPLRMQTLRGAYSARHASNSSISWDPSAWQAVTEGYCFTCDRSVQIKYYRYWAGTQPSRTCLHCGGHDVEFLSRVAGRLLERIEELEQRLERGRQGLCDQDFSP